VRPLFDRARVRRGVLVFVTQLGPLLQDFDRITNDSGALQRGYMLSLTGTVLNPGGGGRGVNFAPRFPEVWKRMAAQQSGVVDTSGGLLRFLSATVLPWKRPGPGGLFLFRRLQPFSPPPGASGDPATADSFRLVVEVPSPSLYRGSVLSQPAGLILVGLPYLLAAVTSLVIADSQERLARRQRHDQSLAQRLLGVMQNAGVGMALCDPASGAIRSANAALCGFFGREEAELLQCRWEELGHPGDRTLDLEQARQLRQGAIDHYGLRRRYQRPDGTSRWGDLVVSAVRDPSGVSTDLVVQISDVTELLQKTAYLEAATAAGIVGIWDWDVEHDVLTWDAVMYQLYGRRPEDFQGTRDAWEQGLHPADKPDVLQELNAALQGLREYQVKFRVVWPDDSVHHVMARGRVSFAGDGRPVRMVGVNYDITAQVERQEELEHQHALMAATVQSLHDPHVILKARRDASGVIVDFVTISANALTCHYAGLSLDQLIGSSLLEILPVHRSSGLLDLYIRAVNTGEPLVLDDFVFPHEIIGEEVHFDIRAIAVGDELSITWRDATARFQMLGRLAESEQRYKLLAENASDVVFRGSPEGVTLWVTPSITDLIGWTPEELIGQPFGPFVHPDDLETLKQARAGLAQGDRQEFRLRVRHRQGGYRRVAVTARGALGPDGRFLGSVGSWRDIEAEVEAEQARALERSRLVATFESLLDPHVVLEARRDASGAIVDFVYTAVNEAASRYNLLAQDQMVGRSVMELLPAHSSTGLLEMYRRVVETGEPLVLDDFTYPHEILGEERRYDIRAVPIGDELSFTWRDVTERHDAACRLAASEESYRLLATNSSDVVVRVRDDTVLWVSPSLTTALGWQPEEWIGHQVRDFLHPGDLDDHQVDLQAITRGESRVRRYRFRDRDGSWHWAEVHAGPFRDREGRIDGRVSSFRLIDNEVAAERLLERQARTDDLTGLLNRREALGRIDRLSTGEHRRGQREALLFCDLDRFKGINDHYGHAAGDLVLCAVAERIRGFLRAEDLAARVGGDELLVVLRGVQCMENALTIAEKIRSAVQEPVLTPAGAVQVSLSIGVTLVAPGEGTDALIARADAAMYEAKQEGRNRVIPIAAPAV
jgi:diguanylate cyclase (GGDEF)-like protein/PAS domain S-box-containing protein